jgi:hypothetical protein
VVLQQDSPEGAQRAALREAVATVEECLGACEVSPATDSLRTAWAVLLDILALGPPPELRACPVCGRNGMRAATRCGYCWTPLAPLDPNSATEDSRKRQEATRPLYVVTPVRPLR